MSFITKLSSLMDEKGISKYKLQKDLNLNKSSILNWTQRETVPSADIVKRIADYLCVPVDYLLSDDKKTSPINGLSRLDYEVIQLMDSMSPEQREEWLKFARFLMTKKSK